MNKRKKSDNGGDQENDDQSKKQSSGVFKLQKTRDIAEARGYFVASLDEKGVILNDLVTELKSGKRDILFFGEPALAMIRRAIGKVDTEENILYDLGENQFALQASGKYVIFLMTTTELNALEFNVRPAPHANEVPSVTRKQTGADDDNDTQVDDETASPLEVNSYDLFDLVNSLSTDAERRLAETKFIADFHSSLYDNVAERPPILYRKQQIWAVIVDKLRELRKKTTVSPMYVYYDLISHNFFASTELFVDTDTRLMTFATNDLLQTFELRRYSPLLEEKFYAQLVYAIDDKQTDTSNVRYGNKPLNDSLIDAYPNLAESGRLTNPHALLFYPALCEFAYLEIPFIYTKEEYIKLDSVVKQHMGEYSAVLLGQTYGVIHFRVFGENLETSEEVVLHIKHSDEFRDVLARKRLSGKSENPKVASSKTLNNSTSRYSDMLNNLYRDEMSNQGYPQTERAEVLFIAMLIYRNFIEKNLSFNETLKAYPVFLATRYSKSEEAVRYCAAANGIDTESSTSVDFERFFEDCIVLATYGRFNEDVLSRWSSMFSIQLEYINNIGRWQGALSFLASKFLKPFGPQQNDVLQALVGVINNYYEACLLSFSNDSNYIDALQEQRNINILVSRFVNETLRAEVFDLTKPDADLVELVDDMLNDKQYTEWPNLTIGKQKLIDYVNRIISVEGLNQCVLLDKVTQSTEYFAEDGGPIATHKTVIDRNKNSVVLYSRAKPQPRVRKMLLLKEFRSLVSVVAAPDELLQRADEEAQERERQEQQRNTEKEKKPVGSFANSTHVDMGLIFEVKINLYPAQHSNTMWRELMFLGVTVYRKFLEFPRPETEIGNRSQFDAWKVFVENNMVNSDEKTMLLNTIEAARRRLIMLLENYSDNRIAAYDLFLSELLRECVKNADLVELNYQQSYVSSARRYEVGFGKLQKTLNLLYELNYVHVGALINENAARFARSLNTYVDQLTLSDDALTSEILLAYNDLLDVSDRSIDRLFLRADYLVESDVERELLEVYKQDAPLMMSSGVTLKSAVENEIKKIPVEKRSGSTVYARRQQSQLLGSVYSIGILRRDAPESSTVTFSNGSTLKFPVEAVENDNVARLFAL